MQSNNKPFMNWQATDLDKEWKRFRQHCDFTFQGPLASKTELEKVNYLMTYIGDKGREIYTTFYWTAGNDDVAAENATLLGVYNKYSQYVAPKKNQIRATVNFNRRKQEQNERFDNFVTDLKILVQDCGYTDPDRMLRDSIVLRSFHPSVREKCLDRGDELTLDSAVAIGQNHETSQESLKIIGVDEDPKVMVVNSRRQRRQNPKHSKQRDKSDSRRKDEDRSHKSQNCGKCGYDRSHARCPAKDSKCNICHKKGHFAAVCRSEGDSANAVLEYDSASGSDSDSYYTHLVKTVSNGEHSDWWENIEVNGHTIRVQLDTGAARSIMPYEVFKTMNFKGPLVQSNCKFESYTHHPIKMEGYVTLPTRYKDKCVDVKYYIAHTRQEPLLSGNVSKQLGLIVRVHTSHEIPVATEVLQPMALDHREIKRRLTEDKERRRQQHDKKSGSDLPPLQAGDPVSMAPLSQGSRKWLPAASPPLPTTTPPSARVQPISPNPPPTSSVSSPSPKAPPTPVYASVVTSSGRI